MSKLYLTQMSKYSIILTSFRKLTPSFHLKVFWLADFQFTLSLLKWRQILPKATILKGILISYMLAMVGYRSDQVSESFWRWKWCSKWRQILPKATILKGILISYMLVMVVVWKRRFCHMGLAGLHKKIKKSINQS